MNLSLKGIARPIILVMLGMYSVQRPVNAQDSQLTDLPTIYITTTQPVDSKDDYRTGTMKIIGAEGTPGLYDGPIEIKGRGNSTWFYPKKPYKIKLGSKFNILGMPAKENKWVLLANARDNTLIRNALAFEISKFMNFPFTVAYRFVDVYLNGTYLGNYMITDQVERGNNRVDINKLDNTMTSEPDVTGGYLVQSEMYANEEPNYFRTRKYMSFSVKYPDEEDIAEEQFNYIKDYIQLYEDKLYSPEALDPSSGYRPLNDRSSQVNWLIACELTGNPDSFLSIYMYKQRNDPKIYFGPLWDFDIAFNNVTHLNNATYKRMSAEAYASEFPKQMLADPELKLALKTRWNQLKAAGLANHLDGKIGELVQLISQSQVKNKEIWAYDNPNNIPDYNSVPYSTFIEELRTYVKRRIAYLDQQFNDIIRSDMYYKLANRSTEKVLDVNSPANNLIEQRTSDDASLSQQWKFIPTEVSGITYYKIQNRNTQTYLSVPNNDIESQLTLASTADSDNQLWLPQGTVHNALYGFINKQSGYTLENWQGSSGESNKIIQNSTQIDASTLQQFTFIPFEAIPGSALPVKVYDLRTDADASGIKISWKVAENINGEKFIVQRSIEPGKVQPDSLGQVILSEEITRNMYEFYDTSPIPGTNYYRLKIVDKDGSTEYSRYVRQEFSFLNDIQLFPQPANAHVNISFTSRSAENGTEVSIFDQRGVKIKSMKIPATKGYNDYLVNTKGYVPGLYHVQFRVSNQVTTKKMLILP